jgi:hypothetical protein
VGLAKAALAVDQLAAPQAQVALGGTVIQLFLQPGFYQLILAPWVYCFGGLI